DWAVPAMRSLGVRYFFAYNAQTVMAANRHADLVPVASSHQWQVYELDGWGLVEPLDVDPVVLSGWPEGAWEAFSVVPTAAAATTGPSAWVRTDDPTVAAAERSPEFSPAVVSDVEASPGRIGFTVSSPGRPVVVRASWFPSWRAKGADGPYRFGPNM